jgi:5-methyltetrahydropteroyltriglutamate--homocysteine methyltransferase
LWRAGPSAAFIASPSGYYTAAVKAQSGFASTFLGNLLTWDEQRRKLERVVETARRVWG